MMIENSHDSQEMQDPYEAHCYRVTQLLDARCPP